MSEKEVFSLLDQILGKKISYIGRASNMLWIGIGEILSGDGGNTERSEFALHIQSTWRIVNREEKDIIVASSDFYSRNSSVLEGEKFEWEVQGNNLFDEKSQTWLEKVSPIYITEYKLNRWADLLLIFSNGERLEVYIDTSDDTECWRLFKYWSDEEHLVVTGLGLVLDCE